MIEALKEAYPVSQLCRVMALLRSSYYAARRARGRTRHDAAEIARVRQIHQETRHSHGSRRMARELSSLGTAGAATVRAR